MKNFCAVTLSNFLAKESMKDPWQGCNYDSYWCTWITAQKFKFSIKNVLSKCDQIRSFLKKSVMEKFIFRAVNIKKCFQTLIDFRNFIVCGTFYGCLDWYVHIRESVCEFLSFRFDRIRWRFFCKKVLSLASNIQYSCNSSGFACGNNWKQELL